MFMIYAILDIWWSSDCPRNILDLEFYREYVGQLVCGISDDKEGQSKNIVIILKNAVQVVVGPSGNIIIRIIL